MSTSSTEKQVSGMNANEDARGGQNSSDGPASAGSATDASSQGTESHRGSHGGSSEGTSPIFPAEEHATCPNPANSDGTARYYEEKLKDLVIRACGEILMGADQTETVGSLIKQVEELDTRASERFGDIGVFDLIDSFYDGDPPSPRLSHVDDWDVGPPEEQKSMQEHSMQPTSSFTSTAGASPQDVPLDQKAPSQAESSHTAMEGKPMRTDSSGTQTEQPGDPDGEDGGVGTSKSTTGGKVAQSGDFRGFRKGFLLK